MSPATPPATERYERVGRIATGGMGEVWRARDTVLDRPVAVKVLKQEYADDPGFRARFENEARHAASLHHPGIAAVFDYGVHEDAGTPYLVMELVEGRPLSELLAPRQPFDPDQARALVAQAADALGVAHAAGMVHRDVKPANLIVTPEGQVKVTDFGIARAVDAVPLTATGQLLGTPHYLSPEQARGESAGVASDVYSLGVVLYECLAGRRPFDRETAVATALAHVRDEPPALPGGVPPDLAAIVTRSLAKDPAGRYHDGAALAAALRGRTGPTPPPTLVAPAVTEATRVLPVPGAPASPTRAPAAGVPGRLLAGGVVALLLLAALLVWHPWTTGGATAAHVTTPTGSPSPATRSASPASVSTVRVARSAYVGRPVADVRRDLERLGLHVSTREVTNPGGQREGTVADVSPTGSLARGSTVTVQAWAAATRHPGPGPGPAHGPAHAPGHGPGHGKGHDNGGQGG